jgi:sialate O-acetylesterase
MNLSSILSDGMVLQRNAKVSIWGKTQVSQAVEISFRDKIYNTTSNSNGEWTVILDNLDPGGPYQMVITADGEKSVIQDILVGDVYVLGGQSNMQLPVSRTLDLYEEEITAEKQPFIRQFAVPQLYNFHAPQQDITDGRWISANPTDIMQFSAAGFFFARALYKTYGVPIGLILTAIGGTPIEAWMSEKTLREIGGYETVLEQCKDDSYITDTQHRDEERNQNWHKALNENDAGLKEGWFEASYDASKWESFELPNAWTNSPLESLRGAVWFRKEFDIPASMAADKAKLSLGTIVDADETYVNGKLVGSTGYRYPPRRYSIPEGPLKSGTNSITVRVISYQTTGEFIKDMPYKLVSNDQEIDLEGTWKYCVGSVTEALEPATFFQYKPSGLYNGMISPLQNYGIKGVLWYQGESNTGRPEGYRHLFKSLVKDWRNNWNIDELPFIFTQLPNFGEAVHSQTDWAELREEQRMGLDIPYTAMAVTIDLGQYNELHPQNKKPLGQRLALSAKKIVYGEDIVYSGPLYNRMEKIGNAIHLYFKQVGSGLVALNEEKLKGFEVCGPDGVFVPANATVSDEVVIVSHSLIEDPLHVRYAYLNNPEEANLYNKEGLPASPFTTEGEPSTQ